PRDAGRSRAARGPRARRAGPARRGGRVSRRLTVANLGRRPYIEVLELQRRLCRERMAGERQDDVLLLVEHERVVTLGRSTRPSSLPLSRAALARQGVSVVEVERGGDVTYHG